MSSLVESSASAADPPAASQASTPNTSDSEEDGRRSNGAVAHTGKKVVLVTGVAGFIGSHTAEVLLARGDEVVGVDEVNDYYDPALKRANLEHLVRAGGERFRFYEGDICDAKFITNIFETEQPRWVVHLAARAGVRPSIEDPFIYVHSNVEATTRLLELARKNGNENFVFASSSSVYGGSTKTLFSEADDVSCPVSPYAATKKSCELLAYTYHHLYNLNVAGLRFFTVFGPRGRPDMAPFKFIDRVSRGEEIQQFGDGSTSRDYTYVDDIVDGVVRSLDRPLGYQIYNLGNGSPVRLCDFIATVEAATGAKATIRILPEQPGDVPRTCADITKARTLLGYEPQTPFAEGIRKLAEWYADEYAPALAKKQAEAAALAAAALEGTVEEKAAMTAASPSGGMKKAISTISFASESL